MQVNGYDDNDNGNCYDNYYVNIFNDISNIMMMEIMVIIQNNYTTIFRTIRFRIDNHLPWNR